jgi:glutamine amidotransferase
MIIIVDYGVGNIQAFCNIYKQLGIPIKRAQSAYELEGATKIILPGVGAFDYAMTRLSQSGMRETLNHLVLDRKVPIVGICVGMQMLALSSEEGLLPGLGWVDGTVKKFDIDIFDHNTPLPHMGWNDVKVVKNNNLLIGLENEAQFYFLHSYYFETKDPKNVIASTHYSQDFACAVNYQNIYGVQFHPEKSHEYGIALLKNFSDL